MFQVSKPTTMAGSAWNILELIFHSTVRELRKSHGNAVIGLLLSMLQAVIFVGAFYFMFMILGLKNAKLRGDFLLYIMSGVFLFLTHNKAMSAVFGSEGSTSSLLKHAPLNSFILIASAALGALYMQTLSLLTILFLYHALGNPVEIHDPVGAFGMLLLAWFSGVSIGMLFLAAKPWFPTATGVVQTLYSRANMIASGKMFVANATPGYMLKLFDWNPLFHAIDQERGYVFVNYFPHHSNITYPLILSLVFVSIGLLGEFFTRRHVSMSWGATR